MPISRKVAAGVQAYGAETARAWVSAATIISFLVLTVEATNINGLRRYDPFCFHGAAMTGQS